MIKTEEKIYGSRTLRRTYSDQGFMIKKVGTEEIYAEAVDVLNNPFTYEETSELIPFTEEEVVE